MKSIAILMSIISTQALAVYTPPPDHGLDTSVYVVATISNFESSVPKIEMDFKKQKIIDGKVSLASTSSASLSSKSGEMSATLENLARVAVNVSRLCFRIENAEMSQVHQVEYESSFVALGGLVNQLIAYRSAVRVFVNDPSYYKTLVATGDLTLSGTNVYKNSLQLVLDTIKNFDHKNPNHAALKGFWVKLTDIQIEPPAGNSEKKIEWLSTYIDGLKAFIEQVDVRPRSECLDPFKH